MSFHDPGDYERSTTAAAKRGRDKLEGMIEKGRASAEGLVYSIQSRVIEDKIVAAAAMQLTVDEDGDVFLLAGGEQHPIHQHAYNQLLAIAGVDRDFANHLTKEAGGKLWGKGLLCHNVNTIMSNRLDAVKDRHLIRAEGESGLVKGILSNKFRRLDSRPLLDAFLGACVEQELIPYEGVMGDTKMRVRAILPYVFEPVREEVMCFGLEFGNSDYGTSGVVVNLWSIRIICSNLMIVQKCLRQVHLGGRLPEHISFSESTYRKDAETTASAIRDVVEDAINPARVNRMLNIIKDADETELKRDGIDKLIARAVDKTELAHISSLYDSPDVVNLPAGETVWRLSNAVSFFAQSRSVEAERRLELQDLAGRLVAGDTKVVREVSLAD